MKSHESAYLKINSLPAILMQDQPIVTSQGPPQKIPEDYIKSSLKKHRKWLDTERKEGERADFGQGNATEFDFEGECLREATLHKTWLSQAAGADLRRGLLTEARFVKGNLQKADLREAKMTEARLKECDLTGAKLQGARLNCGKLQKAYLDEAHLEAGESTRPCSLKSANLEGTYIREANLNGVYARKASFKEADLMGTTLYDADLRDTDFESAKGLEVSQLGGADVTGANLPSRIADFAGLETVTQTSKNARKLFLAVLLASAYVIITIYSFSDRELLLGEATAELPVIGTSVPTWGFFMVAPVVLIVLFVSLHLHLQRLWEQMGDLPAVFVDGKPLDEKVYPWLLNGLIRQELPRLKNRHRPALYGLQRIVYITAAWAVVPVTVAVLGFRYLVVHSFLSVIWHAFLLFSCSVAAFAFFKYAVQSLRHERVSLDLDMASRLMTLALKWIAARPKVEITGWFAFVAATSFLFAFGIFDIYAFESYGFWIYVFSFVLTAVLAGSLTFLEGYARSNARESTPRKVIGAYVAGALMLAVLLASTLILRPANLARADLTGVDLSSRNLRGADLRGADLEGANLSRTDLRGAKGVSAERLCQATSLSDLTVENPTRRALAKQCPTKLEPSQSSARDQ